MIKLYLTLVYLFSCVFGKYMEGEIDTSENFAFIARFCFLSDEGEFEFFIEYNEDQGEPNLLLYYDEDDQWPAVYKTDTTCLEKESVLKLGQNQILNLTRRLQWREVAGCSVSPLAATSPTPQFSISVTPPPPRKRSRNSTRKVVVAPLPTRTTEEDSGAVTGESGTTLTESGMTMTESGITLTENEMTLTDRTVMAESGTIMAESGTAMTERTTMAESGTTMTESDAITGESGTTIKDSDTITEESGTKRIRRSISGSSYETSTVPYLTVDKFTTTKREFYQSGEDNDNFDSSINEASTLSSLLLLENSRKERAVKFKPQPPPYRNYELKLGRTVSCRNKRRFRSARARWWFVAISNCKGSMGIRVKYRILMTNGPTGDYWHQHFSADEFYILPVLMAFSIAYSFLILMIIICSIELKSRQLLHSTYKLFCLSVCVQLFGILLDSMAYLKYAVNGVGAPKLKVTGFMFMGCSETCFLLLLLLLAKGYTVTRGRLPLSAGVKLTVFMCIYAVTYISLFIYEAKVFDPGEVLYLYESPAGYGLIILRILAWCMFIYSTVFTLKHYPEKANFYYPFNILGTLWFIAGPAFILTANSYIDKWVRESIVCAVLLFITFAGHIMFMLLTMPSVANKNFPYHVRTTQIGVMELTGATGTSTIEQFGHHVYAPSYNNSGPLGQYCNAGPGTNIHGHQHSSVMVPLTKRTEEIFGGLYTQYGSTRSGGHPASTTTAQENNGQGVGVSGGGGETQTEMTVESVMGWTLAKNVKRLAVPFEGLQRYPSGSANSNGSNSTSYNDNSLRRQSSLAGGGDDVTTTPPPANQDWIKEVPVELFTISKMVITKHNQQPRIHDID